MDVSLRVPAPIEGDDNGYHAWLRYPLIKEADKRDGILVKMGSCSGAVPAPAAAELDRMLKGMTRHSLERRETGGALVYTLEESRKDLELDGFEILKRAGGFQITARTHAGLVYATFTLIRFVLLDRPVDQWAVQSGPTYPIRMLNHWDDPKFDHTIGPYNVTRGFAGNSIFNWSDLEAENPRYEDYARMLASIGINAICLNNVNADPDVLESGYLPGIQAMADRFRPYNIRVFLSVPFTAPMVCDGTPGDDEYGDGYPFCMRNRKVRAGTLATADPVDARVQAWWKRKAAEIYGLIPDFGGFVIKANSEGMPGPQDYGRTHAEGANCIARALASHGGLLFYRTFVYVWDKRPETVENSEDVCCQAYRQFKPLDGKFDDNVIIQTKCGPADFRSHEPPNPLLGALPRSRQAVEFMIAQEYLGQTTHVCFQGKEWRNILNFDTCWEGKGTTIAAATSGARSPYKPGAIVGVANVGDDPNWFGHLLAGANLYAFGRLGWESTLEARQVLKEWTCMTFPNTPRVQHTVARILEQSYDLYARYTVPLGINYMFEKNHHFEPGIRALKPTNWNPETAGKDRVSPQGSGFLQLYQPEASRIWEKPETTPLPQLLFFHRLPWTHRLSNGKTLAQHVRDDRIEAVEVIREWLVDWRHLQNEVDPQTWAHIYERLQRQYVHAGKWRDSGLKALELIGQLDGEKGREIPQTGRALGQ